MKKLLLLLVLFSLFVSSRAVAPDEGMWIPILIEKFNIKLMQEKGFRLSAEDIYSVNKACMKDAVLSFGGGCTGEVISPEGLLITNHHCGFSNIQSLSSLDHDYLANGYWAMSKSEELPCPGLTVTFLKRMEDVTEMVFKGVTDGMDKDARNKLIASNTDEIRRKAVSGTGYTASVRPFYMGNQYFLLVYETFNDVRFVGAPPSAIGKFGDETDNWVWPRHTGDFSLFRIYAGKENKPAGYSKENVPYKPLYHFPISLRGTREGDFTMVFGYPGSTTEYVPSYYIDMVKNYINPKMIELRTSKIEIMRNAMNSDKLIRLQYAAKKSGLDNSWKRWIGETQGLERMKTIEKKQEFEKQLTEWINADEKRKAEFGNILPSYKALYEKLREYSLVSSYTSDVFFTTGAEAVAFSRYITTLAGIYEKNGDVTKTQQMKEDLVKSAKGFFKNYNQDVDKKLFVAVMTLYGQNLDPKWQAPEYIRIKEECGGNFQALADRIYTKSVFTDEARFDAFVLGFNVKSLKKLNAEVFYQLAKSAADVLNNNVRNELIKLQDETQNLNREYMKCQLEYQKDRLLYPDANSTLRVAYGTMMGYDSRDGVHFKPYTTLKGIMEKDNPDVYDYAVPAKLKELYKGGDYGRYGENGELHICFIANNHTTGGNSGSPVLNADGQLIGVNFDRAWEGVASDMAFNPDQSRNISLDIRYALFIIDKFAGAGYLLNEMTILQ
jgi:hypothetical protein